MHDKLERLNRLFSSLSEDQQDDILNLLETWIAVQRTIANQNERSTGSPNQSSTEVHPSLSEDWLCVNTLREMVREQFRPTVELAYIAFHRDLDSISTAKSRTAVERMFELEAAYELKSILETQPDSSIITKEWVEEFQNRMNKPNKQTPSES